MVDLHHHNDVVAVACHDVHPVFVDTDGEHVNGRIGVGDGHRREVTCDERGKQLPLQLLQQHKKAVAVHDGQEVPVQCVCPNQQDYKGRQPHLEFRLEKHLEEVAQQWAPGLVEVLQLNDLKKKIKKRSKKY